MSCCFELSAKDPKSKLVVIVIPIRHWRTLSKQTVLNKKLHMDSEIFRKLGGFSITCFAAAFHDKANRLMFFTN